MAPRSTRTRVLTAAVGALVTLALTGCGPDATPSATAPSATPSTATPSTAPATSPEPVASQPAPPADPASVTGTAAAALATLEVKGRAPKTGYDRDQFGQAWSDDVDVPGGHNGCDTRNDILARDLTGETFKPGTRDCVVLTGTLADPYSGTTIAFQRGQDTSMAVQIDHVVALSNSWQTGSFTWDATKRANFANDPLNLLAADGPLNGQKSDADAATWLPPNKAFRCAYVARQVAVKAKYGLWVTPAEKDAIARVLDQCPNEPLPTDATSTVPAAGAPAGAPAPAPAAAPAPAGDGTDPQFDTCKAAKAAGYGPYTSGQPEYGWYSDRDGDGVVCE